MNYAEYYIIIEKVLIKYALYGTCSSLLYQEVRTLVNRDIKSYPPTTTQGRKKSQAIHYIITTNYIPSISGGVIKLNNNINNNNNINKSKCNCKVTHSHCVPQVH